MSSLCMHAFHFADLEGLEIHVVNGWMPAIESHSTCTIHKDRMWLPLWLNKRGNKKQSHTQKSHWNWEPQRSGWEHCWRRRTFSMRMWTCSLSAVNQMSAFRLHWLWQSSRKFPSASFFFLCLQCSWFHWHGQCRTRACRGDPSVFAIRSYWTLDVWVLFSVL